MNEDTTPRRLVWYARAKGIACIGPYDFQHQAWKAIMGLDGLPAEGALVWCEECSTDC